MLINRVKEFPRGIPEFSKNAKTLVFFQRGWVDTNLMNLYTPVKHLNNFFTIAVHEKLLSVKTNASMGLRVIRCFYY